MTSNFRTSSRSNFTIAVVSHEQNSNQNSHILNFILFFKQEKKRLAFDDDKLHGKFVHLIKIFMIQNLMI